MASKKTEISRSYGTYLVGVGEAKRIGQGVDGRVTIVRKCGLVCSYDERDGRKIINTLEDGRVMESQIQPEECRKFNELFALGHSYSEIARITGRSRGAISARLRKVVSVT